MNHTRTLSIRTKALLLAAGLGLTGTAMAPPASAAPVASSRTLAGLRQCESSNNYAANTGNGYYGAYQFSLSTWRSLGYRGRPHEAAPGVQDQAASRLAARSGWGQWPACSRRLGVR
jgi:hypothetical protein